MVHHFYNEKVEAETLSFPPGILANFLHIAEMIGEYGPLLGEPYTKALVKDSLRYDPKEKKVLGDHYSVPLKYFIFHQEIAENP